MITKNAASRTLLVCPIGDLDALTAEHYRQSIAPLLDEGYRFIIFDFEQTEYITSSGLGLLVELYNKVTAAEGSLRLINCGERVQWLLRQTKLDNVLTPPATDEAPEPAESISFDPLHSLMSQELLFCSRLNEVAQKALKSTDRFEVAKLILDGVVGVSGTSQGVVYFLDEERNRLQLAAEFAMTEELRQRAFELPIDPNGPEFILIKQNEIGRPGDRSDSGGRSPELLWEKIGFRRAIQVPISGVRKPFGIVVIEEPEEKGQEFDALHPLLRTFATICGLALENTDLLCRLQSKNGDLQHSLTEIQKFQETLVDVGKLAALGAVISGLGHLLNNKLVPIIGYTQLLAQGADLTEKAKHQLDIVNNTAVELKDIMEKLIKVSKVRDVHRESVDINEVVAKTTTLLGYHIEHNQVRVELRLEDALPSIMGDHDLLLQALLAIMHRACSSFQEENDVRWISIATRDAGSTVEIEVEDNGAGLGHMSEEDWLDPLVPYTELDGDRLFNYSIPRSVARRHKGTLVLTERPEGGTLVRMSLPVSRDKVPSEAISVSQREKKAA